jgi:hypothetical protein
MNVDVAVVVGMCEDIWRGYLAVGCGKERELKCNILCFNYMCQLKMIRNETKQRRGTTEQVGKTGRFFSGKYI